MATQDDKANGWICSICEKPFVGPHGYAVQCSSCYTHQCSLPPAHQQLLIVPKMPPVNADKRLEAILTAIDEASSSTDIEFRGIVQDAAKKVGRYDSSQPEFKGI